MFDFLFGKPEKEKPKVRGYAFGSTVSTYDINNETFYTFYKENPYVAACVDRIRRDVGANGYEIRRHKKVNEEAMKQFTSLLSVTSNYTPRMFIKRIVRDFEITGNAYIFKLKEKGRITAIQPLDPRYVKPISSVHGQILGYVQQLGGNRYFLKDEIIHFKDDNDIEDEIVGRSKLSSLFLDIETDKEARDSNLAFFRNNQTPASLVVFDKEYEFPAEEADMRKQIKEIFESGKYKGGKNHHRGAVIEGVEKIIPLQDKVSDMEFSNTRRFTLELVCAVFGVNKDILGFTETSNRSVGDVQSSTYWMMIEDKEKLIDEFMDVLIKEIFGQEYTYVTIKDNLRTLQLKTDIATKLYKEGELITLNEARNIVQYEKAPDGDHFYSKTAPQVSDEKPTKI